MPFHDIMELCLLNIYLTQCTAVMEMEYIGPMMNVSSLKHAFRKRSEKNQVTVKPVHVFASLFSILMQKNIEYFSILII